MNKSTRKTILQGTAVAVGVGLGAWGIIKLLEMYRQDTEELVATLYAHSQVFETAVGQVEAAIFGDGPAVMVVHGAAGGYDQGAVKSEEFRGIKYISVSRPGYLRTPLSSGVTPEEQADAMAALMDTLGIEKAAFIGMSTGGLVSIQFALKYPQRCWGLVLLSSVNAPLHLQLNALRGLSPLVKTDFLPWMLMHPETLMLVRPHLRKQVAHNPEKLEVIQQLIKTAYPTSMRLSGMLNDGTQIEDLQPIPLEEIHIPTLVIHGDADDVVPFSQGVESARRIPNAQFLPVSGGTHYCALTHLELTRPVIMDFLQKHAPEKLAT
jgi:pimeloyl-ACP methyl ester carboxylesterase